LIQKGGDPDGKEEKSSKEEKDSKEKEKISTR